MTTTAAPAGLIPDRLLANIKKGDCVLFLGADLPLGYPGAPLSRPELAAALAKKDHLPPRRSWAETATAYLGKVRNDRNGLIRFLTENVTGPGMKAGSFHQAIARAGFRAIVTAWYDEWLEESLRDAGYRVHRVARDIQLPYGEQGERDVTVIKLFGTVSEPDSLVLTAPEQVQLIGQLGQKLTAIISFATIRPLLLVGYDLTDPILMALYYKASEGVVEHMRLPDEVDREFVLRVLLARERLQSTGIGDGLAIPHVRNPIVLHVSRPMITLCFLERAIEFDALDGKPVFALFSLISPTVRAHLRLLSRLAFGLNQAGFKDAVLRQASRDEILEEARRAEAAVSPRTAGDGGQTTHR